MMNLKYIEFYPTYCPNSTNILYVKNVTGFTLNIDVTGIKGSVLFFRLLLLFPFFKGDIDQSVLHPASE